MKYAKLAAERGRIWVKKMEPDDGSSESSYESRGRDEQRKAELKKVMNEYKKMLDVSTLAMEQSGGASNPLKREFFFC